MLTHCDGNQLRIVSMHHSLIPPMDGQTLADVGNTHTLYYLIPLISTYWIRWTFIAKLMISSRKKKCSKTMINSTVQLTKLWEQKWLKPWNCIYFSLKCGGDKRDYKWMPFKCCAELKYRFISLIHHFDHCLKWFYIISWARS